MLDSQSVSVGEIVTSLDEKEKCVRVLIFLFIQLNCCRNSSILEVFILFTHFLLVNF